MTAKASLDDARYHDPAAFRKLLDESTAAMRQIPGVQDAAVGLSLPYERALINGATISDGKEAGQKVKPMRSTSPRNISRHCRFRSWWARVHRCETARMRSTWPS